MIDWSDQYNPFNSDKALIWREWMEGCAKKDFRPPVTIYVDPSSRCGWNCIWCNSADYNAASGALIPEEHLLRIADFAASWGVKSIHVFGGGEPLMNPALGSFLRRVKANGLEAGLITNGALLNENKITDILDTCRWVGISLDAGTPETYMKVKGMQNRNLFSSVLEKIGRLCQLRDQRLSSCSVCVKYLLHPVNAQDIFQAAGLAKKLGVNDFQVRPAGWENVRNKNIQRFSFDGLLDMINQQMQQAQSLESESFHVYGVWHKFSPGMEAKRPYSRCWASPLALLFGADGNCYVCGDRRGQREFVLCRHDPDVEQVRLVWNTKYHHNILDTIKLEECPRCVMGPYHHIVEKVFIKDQMCRNFP
jgi:MoaA/NifB/PqqE/SkfB family radical SAM enzyme